MIGAKNNLKETLFNLLVGEWHIDINYAHQEFNKYVEKIELLNSGVSFSDLFKAQKDESGKLAIVSSYGAATVVSSFDDITENGSILELSFSGVMRDEDGMCSYGINSLANNLYSAYGNSKVSGILLNINSGGGYSSAGYTLQQAIADKNKPVVVRAPLLASAALNGALPATEIVAASDASEIGSIGTYITLNLKALEEYKAEYKDVYATVSPDKNKAFRNAVSGDFSELEKYVTKNAEMFQSKVSQFLTLKESTKDSTLSGGMFFAQDAKRRGLVHSVGSKQFAVKRILSHIKYSSI